MIALVLELVLSAQVGAAAPDLTEGIRAAREGDFEAAVLTLDAAARRLSTEPHRAAELVEAYLYLGVAYVGLGQEGLARAKFREALARDPKLDPSPQEFSRRVLRVFDEARREVASGKAIERQARRGMGKTPWVLLGAGAAGAAAATALFTKERLNSPPTASFTVAPEGVAIAGVTDLLFRASASDPEGDALSYEWQFGDGRGGSGAIVAHQYDAAGTFTVVLSVRDGADTTDVTGRVSVASLVGRWRTTSGTFPGLLGMEVTSQTHSNFDLEPLAIGWDSAGGSHNGGLLVAPRHVSLRMRISLHGQPERWAHFNFLGDADTSVRTLAGTLYCSGPCPIQPTDWPETFVRE